MESYAEIAPTDAAYIAGFFDGEGCITSNKYSFTIRVIISQKDPEVLFWICNLLGYGQVVERMDRVSAFRVSRSVDVKHFLSLVYPYLRGKKAQADIAFKVIETASPIGVRVGDERIAIRRSLVAELTYAKGKASRNNAGMF